MTFTVLGASGFIGSHLAQWFREQGLPHWAPGRHDDVLSKRLGHVIYCIGLTADFRQRPYDTVRAHVCKLVEILERADFESLLYLSTTRLYGGVLATGEDAVFPVQPADPSDLYNISKLMGESLCLTSARPTVRVARLSNVYGEDLSSANFLSSVIREAVNHGHVTLSTTTSSEKDYVSVRDVVNVIPRIAELGCHRVYNVASGINTTNAALMAAIQRRTGCTVEVIPGAKTTSFPAISIKRLQGEFNFAPGLLLDTLDDLIVAFQREAGKQ